MRILFLSDNFPPEVNAPASRTFEHCREWVRAGHAVTVVTCVPNFPQGKVYPGYRNRLWQTEVMEGIRVIRVWSYIAANAGFLKRILDYMSFMVSAVLASPVAGKADVVIGTSPQFFTACAAYAVSRLKHIPFVFELRDIWPESIKAVGAMRDAVIIRWLEKLEVFLYRRAAKIVCVTESFKRTLVGRGIDGSKIEVVTNGVEMTRFRPQPKDTELAERFGLNGDFVAGYVGTHGMAHGLETVLQAADAVGSGNGGGKYQFILLGNGAKKRELMELAGVMGLENVTFIDSVPKEEVARYWSLLDAAIIHLKKTDLFTKVIPSKLFECMGMGIPVLHGVTGESADIVRKEKVGVVFEPENVEELCEKLVQLREDKQLYQELRDNCLKAAGHYDRAELAARMLDILQKVSADYADWRRLKE